jgi:pimeloyl-ACP methyl ester carboxylesterase
MPTAEAEGDSLYYETAGSGETVAFVGDAGFGAWQWGGLFDAVTGPRRGLVWDLPGTGRSADPAGSLDVDRLSAALDAVLADAGVGRAHVVGAGLGGMVALRYARRFDRARSVAALGTAASGTDVDEPALRALHPASRTDAALRESLAGAFSPAYLERADGIKAILDWRRAEDATGEALAAQIAAMCGFEAGPLFEIGRPALVCHGVDDRAVPQSAGESLAESLPRAEFVPVTGRHLAHLESGPAVADRLLDFLDSVR